MPGQFTPTLVAAGNIAPYRFVAYEASGTDNKVVEASVVDKQVIGISDGSGTAFDSANHASTGEIVRLQSGPVRQLEIGQGVSTDAGGLLVPFTGGTGIESAAVPGENYWYARALQDGASGEIIDVLWLGQVSRNSAVS